MQVFLDRVEYDLTKEENVQFTQLVGSFMFQASSVRYSTLNE
jgi:hypothetical protein